MTRFYHGFTWFHLVSPLNFKALETFSLLEASTTAYLTACYALGVRDGHDDNIMLREDGSLFRVDFGFVFGATPEIDTPQTVVARAVARRNIAIATDRIDVI